MAKFTKLKLLDKQILTIFAIVSMVLLSPQVTTAQNVSDDIVICENELHTTAPIPSTNKVSYATFNRADHDAVDLDVIVPSLAGTTNRSVFLWVRVSSYPTETQAIVGINETGGDNNISNLQIGTDGKIRIYDGEDKRSSTSPDIVDGQWHFIGYTYFDDNGSGTNGLTNLYVDGVLVSTFEDNQTFTTNDFITLGLEYDGNKSSPGNFYHGDMTEVSFWNTVLGTDDIALLQSGVIESTHPEYANLVAYYPMNVASGQTITEVRDISGSDFHGTASATDIQSTTNVAQITGFNSSEYFTPYWYQDGANIATDVNTITIDGQLSDAGVYSFELSRDYVTAYTDIWNVTVNPAPIITQQPTDDGKPVGGTAVFDVTSNVGTYQWYEALAEEFVNRTTSNGLPNNTIREAIEANGKIYAATYSGLAISYDAGVSFITKTTTDGLGNIRCYGVSEYNNTIYVGTKGGVSFSTDGGSSFTTKTTTDGLISNTCYDVVVNNDYWVVATMSGVSISTNEGSSFINKTDANGLGDNECLDAAIDNGNIYVATNSGLSISTDGGSSFTNYLSGTSCYAVSVENGNIYVATYSGIQVSTDGGTSFTPITTAEGLVSNSCNDVFVKGQNIYVATSSGLSVSTDNGNNFTTYNTTDGLGNNLCYSVNAQNNTTLVGTSGGLSIYPYFTTKSGETNNSLTLSGLTSDMYGNQYNVKITNPTTGCSIVSDAAELIESSLPVAQNTAVTLEQYTSISSNLTALVTEPEGEDITFTAVTNAAMLNGTISIGTNGVYTFNPNNNSLGADTYVYEVCDIYDNCATANIEITVVSMAQNDFAELDCTGSVSSNVAGNDSPLENKSLTVTSGSITSAFGATVTIDAAGDFSYTAPAGHCGETDSFVYETCDGSSNCSTATVELKLNRVQASNIVVSNITHSTAEFSWTRGSDDACVVFVRRKDWESDRSYYAPIVENNDTYSSIGGLGGSGGFHSEATCIYNGTGTSAEFLYMDIDTEYEVFVFEYNGSEGFEDYNTEEALNNPVTFSTLEYSTPTVQVSGLTYNGINECGMADFDYVKGSGTGHWGGVLFFVAEGNPASLPDLSDKLTSEQDNKMYGDWQCTPPEQYSFKSGMQYSVLAIAYNDKPQITDSWGGFDLKEDYMEPDVKFLVTETADNRITFTPNYETPATPTVQSSDVSVTYDGGTYLDVELTPGSGQTYVFIKQANTGVPPVVDGEIYMVSQGSDNSCNYMGESRTSYNKYGDATALVDDGWYCVGNPMGSYGYDEATGKISLRIGDLQTNTEYRIVAFEAPCTCGYYNRTTASNNVLDVTTGDGTVAPVAVPTVQASNLTATNLRADGTKMTLTWERGNGDECIVLQGNVSNPTIPDLQDFCPNMWGSYDNWKIIYRGTGEELIYEQCSPYDYKYAVLEYNKGADNYNTTVETNVVNNIIPTTTAQIPENQADVKWLQVGPDAASYNINTNNYCLTDYYVFLKEGHSGYPTVADTDIFNGHSVFGSGDEVDTDWFCIGDTHISGLTLGTDYRMVVMAIDENKINNTQTADNVVDFTTKSAPPTQQPTNISYTPPTSKFLSANRPYDNYHAIEVERGNGYGVKVFYKENGTGDPDIDNTMTLGQGTTPDGWQWRTPTSAQGSNPGYQKLLLEYSEFNQNTTYRLAVAEYYDPSMMYNTTFTEGENIFTFNATINEPVIEPDVRFFNISNTQFDVSWDKDDITASQVAFISLDLSGNPLVENGVTYDSDTNFGSGDISQNGNWYCIYNGTESEPTVTVTGLNPETSYKVVVKDYGGTPGNEKFSGGSCGQEGLAPTTKYPTIEEVTACGDYTWKNGVTYTETTSTPTYLETAPDNTDYVVRLDLTINPLPSITGHPENVAVTVGDDALFDVSVTSGSYDYQWRKIEESFTNLPGDLSTRTIRDVFEYNGTIYAAAPNGLHISDDGGSTWALKTTTHGLGDNQCYSVFVNNDAIYVGVQNGLSISTDGGTSFTHQSNLGEAFPWSCYGVYVQNDVIYVAVTGEGGHAAYSTDGGTTFTKYNDTQYDAGHEIYAVGDNIYVASESGVYISTNGGTSFTKTNFNRAYDVYAENGNVYVAHEWGLAISTDNGSTFANKTQSNNGLGDDNCNAVNVVNGVIYVATGGGFSISTDGGANFVNKTTADGLTRDVCESLYASSNGKVYIGLNANGVDVYENYTELSGETNDALTVSSVTSDMYGDQYAVEVTNQTTGCSIVSDIAQINSDINTAPVANNASITLDEDTSISSSLAAYVSDADNDVLTFTAVTNVATSNGTISLAANGDYTYTPEADYFGADSYIYEVCDPDNSCATATLNITVNDVPEPNNAPVASNSAITVDEDGSISSSLAAFVTDADYDDLIFTETTDAATLHGTISIGTNGAYTYTPIADYFGSDSYTYEVCDIIGDCSTATINITVNAVNDIPVASNETVNTDEDTQANGNLTSNVSDTENDDLVFTEAIDVATMHGTISIGTNGAYTYTPDADYNGSDRYVYEVCDVNGDCATAEINITVDAVNDAPVATNESVTTDEDTQANGNLTSKATDVENDDLIFTETTDAATLHGTISIGTNGAYTYTPDADYFGSDSYVYEVCDINGDCSTATIDITIDAVNDAPLASNSSITVDEDGSISSSLSAYVSDTDADDLIFTEATDVPTMHGTISMGTNGTYTYTPDADFFGADSYVYEVCDTNGDCATAEINITVNSVNDAPEALDAVLATSKNVSKSNNLSSKVSDEENDALIFTPATDAATLHGTISISTNGAYTYTPATDYFGTDVYVYEVCDVNGDCATAEININVTEIANAAPVVSNTSISVDEDASVNSSLAALASDPDGDDLIFNKVTDAATLHGTISIGTNGAYTYTPDADYFGSDTYIYEVCDVIGDCTTARIDITVNSVNDAPVATNEIVTTDEDTQASGNLTSNVTDTENDDLIFTEATNVPTMHGTMSIGTDGAYTYTPNADYFGSDSYVYEVCDANGDCATAEMDITVNSVNDTPVATNEIVNTDKDTPASGNLTSNVTDTENDNLIFTEATDAATLHGTMSIGTDGAYTYTPNADYFGSDSYVYEVCDINGDCTTASIDIMVNISPEVVTACESYTWIDGITYTQTTSTPTFMVDNGFGESYAQRLDLTINPLPEITQQPQDIMATVGENAYFEVLTNSSSHEYQWIESKEEIINKTEADGLIRNYTNDVIGYNGNIYAAHGTGLSISTDGGNNFITKTTADGLVNNFCNGVFVYNGVLYVATRGGLSISSDNGSTFTTATTAYSNRVYVNNDAIYVATTNGLMISTDNGNNFVTKSYADGFANNTVRDVYADGSTVLAATSGGLAISVDGGNNFENRTTANGMGSNTCYGVYSTNGVIYVATMDGLSISTDGGATFTNKTTTDGLLHNYGSDIDGYNGQVYFTTRGGGLAITADAGSSFTSITTNEGLIGNTALGVNANSEAVYVATIDGISIILSDSNMAGETNASVALSALTADMDGSEFMVEITDPATGCSVMSDMATLSINKAPVANNATATVDEDESVNGSLTSSVSDPEGQDLTFTEITDATTLHGTISISTNGTYTYTPDADYNGSDSYTYEVCDTYNVCATAEINITINSVNDVPVATVENVTTDEDVPANGNLTAKVTDTENDNLIFNKVTDAATLHGTITVTENGDYIYTPANNYFGTDSYTYTVCDVNGGCTTANINITVNPINDPLTAQDDYATTKEDEVLNGATVLTNDFDIDNSNLSVTTIPQPNVSNGTLELYTDGTYIYTPNLNFTGTDIFTYEVCNDENPQECTTASVTIAVTPVDNDPIFANNDAASVNEDDVLNGTTVLSNDGDFDNSQLTVNSVPVSNVSNGTLQLFADGTYIYTPNLNFSGTDRFTYKVCNDETIQECTTAIVTITVNPLNDPLVAENDGYTMAEDEVLSGKNILTNDFDLDNSTLSVNTTPVSDVQHGTLQLLTTGTFTYTPDANYNGNDSFTYQVCNNENPQECETAIVTINITPVNDPLTAVDDSYSVNEDGILNASTIMVNDFDLDGSTISVSVTPQPNVSNGTLELHTDGTFIYTPNVNFNGSDSFEYELVNDENPQETTTATVTITVTPVNDPLVAVDDSYTVNEDAVLNGTTVLINDFDIDGSALSVNTNPVSDVSNGTLVLNNDGTFTYSPNANFNGSDSFVYEVCNDENQQECTEATVTITVTPVNDPLVATNDSYTVNEDAVLNGTTVLINDFDLDNSNLSVTTDVVSNVQSGTLTLNSDGTFVYTPLPNFNGSDSFVYEVCNDETQSECTTATVTINIKPVNNDPIFAGDDFASVNEDEVLTQTISVLTNDGDLDNSTLSVNINPVSDVSNGTLTINADGTYTYTPDKDFNGIDYFTYQVCNDEPIQECTMATVTITVNPINDPLVAVDNAYTINEDAVLNAKTVLTNDYDIDGSQLTVNIVPQPNVSNGTLELQTDGTFTYTPNSNFNGTDNFVYQVCNDENPQECETATVNITVLPVNDPLVAVDDSYTVNEDGILNAPTIMVNDYDKDGSQLTVNSVAVNSTQHGTLQLATNGTFTYTPNANFYGTDNFVYQLQNNENPQETTTATVTITVNPANDPLVAVNDNYTVNEDAVLNGKSVLINDFDIDGSTLSVRLVPQPNVSNGTLELHTNGTFTYTPNANFNGTDSFVYEVCNDENPQQCETATVTITVAPSNDPLVAVDDSYTVNEDAVLNGSTIMANDYDIDGSTLSVSINPVSDVQNGTLTLNADGTFTYTPDTDFNGVDRFIYELLNDENPQERTTATVTISIKPVDNDPIFAGNDFASVNEGGILNASTILANDGDLDGSNLSVNTNPVQDVQNGTLQLNADGTYTYTPNTDFNGTDSFVYEVCNDETVPECTVATVTITVNPVNDPLTAVDDNYSMAEDGVLSGKNILNNDSDIDGSTLSVNTTPTRNPQHGTLQLATNGTFTYTPDANFNGTDSFVYEVCNNENPQECETATVNITVTPVNDPLVAVDDSYTVNEDGILNASTIMMNDYDIDGSQLTVNSEAVNSTQHGTLQLETDGTFTYTPNANFYGTDNFVYQLQNDENPQETTTATVTITVNPVNDPLVATDDSYSISEDNVLSGKNVLNNDFDIDGSTLSVNTSPTSNPQNGTLVINADGTFTYTPDANFNGTDSFVYQVCNDENPQQCETATVTIIVTPVNDPLTAVNDNYTVNEDVVLNGRTVLINDFDKDGSTLTVTTDVVSNVQSGALTLKADGTFVYTPFANFNGTDYFTYQVCNDENPQECTQATVKINIKPVDNDPIFAADDFASVNEDEVLNGTTVLSNDGDLDGSSLSVNINPVSDVTNGTLVINPDGTYVYTPDENFNGTDEFVYEVCNDEAIQECTYAKVTITVNPINDPLTAVGNKYSVNEDAVLIGKSVLVNDSDKDGSQLTVNSVAVSNVQSGTLELHTDGTFVYTPNANFIGNDYFTYEVCNNENPQECSTAIVTINVTPVNDPLIAIGDIYTVNEDGILNASTIIINDYDLDGSFLSVNVVPQPNVSNGTLELHTDGTFTYTPDANFHGVDYFTYQLLNDENPQENTTAIVTINITPANDPLTAVDDKYSVNEDGVLNGKSVLINDYDIDGSTLSVSLIPQPNVSNGTLELHTDGTFTYTPNANFNGTDQFTYEVCNDETQAECTTATVTITVSPVNDPLIAIGDEYTVNEDEVLNGTTVLINDSDADGSTLIVNTIAQPNVSNGTLELHTDGTFTYTPNADYFGTDYFTYKVCNDENPQECTTAIVTINIVDMPDNLPPMAINDAITVDENSSVSSTFATNDSDPDGDDLIYTDGMFTTALGGTISISTNGTYTYTPLADVFGTDSYVYTVCDVNGDCATAELQITVNEVIVNQPPIAVNDAVTLDENGSVSSTFADNDSDPDGDELVYTAGTFTTNAGGTLVIETNGAFTYTPAAEYFGADSYIYTVCDVNGECATAELTITVNEVKVNQPPIAVDDEATLETGHAFNGLSLLDNDSDPDGDELIINTTPIVDVQNGQLIIHKDGTYTYKPDFGFTGTETFEYEVCDNGSPAQCTTAWVTLEVVARDIIILEAFSPNNDGRNDLLVVPGLENYPNHTLYVINRWGNKVFEASPYNQDWDGKSNTGLTIGEDLPNGTYFVIIDTGDGVKKQVKGFIRLKRN